VRDTLEPIELRRSQARKTPAAIGIGGLTSAMAAPMRFFPLRMPLLLGGARGPRLAAARTALVDRGDPAAARRRVELTPYPSSTTTNRDLDVHLLLAQRSPEG
jgi:hypothetical protein